MSTTQDQLYAIPHEPLSRFTFDDQVAAVFPDMIRRSVPGYADILHMLSLITHHYAQPDSQLYDLGCSLGAASLAMAQGLTQPGCQILAIDQSSAMITRARTCLTDPTLPIILQQADISTQPIHNASVVVLNFTLQFIPPEQRLALLNRIHRGLRPGGILVLSEKITSGDADEQAELEALHHAYKRANAYSELEISQKRAALEQVLIPETRQAHETRLQTAGYQRCTLWYQHCQFVSWIAHA
ncbi:MAG: carboxy-S-adenosyl-L-methionine synthase CmoA [Pseudomonadota bacterium]